MHDLLDPMKNPVTYAIPFFVLTILLELAALKWLDNDEPDGRPATGYEVRDTRASLSMGAISLVFTLAFKVGSFVLYMLAFTHLAPWQLPTDTWWYWALVLLGVDLGFYGAHRFVHRVNIGWAAHQAHHSSEYMNFGTALRQKWNPWFEFFFWLPLPLLGFSPWTIYVAFGFNLIFQFFVHTETVGTLPRPIEFVFNTPSHHRVHHGSDPEYLDKNYGGMLIVWDRLFGTFQPETHRPTYGLTKPKDTYNIFKLQYGDYAQISRDVRSTRSWREKAGYLFGPPGWTPQAPSVTTEERTSEPV